MGEEPLGGQYDTSNEAGAVTAGLSAWNPVLGALYGAGSSMGESVRGDGTSAAGGIFSDLIVNPSHGFLTSLKSGDWRDAIPVLGALNRKKRADKAKKEEENFDYKNTQAYKSAEQEANLAYRQMQQGLPEESMRFQEDMIGRSGAAALNTAGNLRQGIAGVGSAGTGLASSYRSLAALDAQQRIANRGQYYDSLGNLRQQEQIAANISYADYVNNQAKLLAQQSARAESRKNNQESAMDAFSLIGNQYKTPTEYGGMGGNNGGFGSWMKNMFGGGKAASQGGTNPYKGTTMDYGINGNIG